MCITLEYNIERTNRVQPQAKMTIDVCFNAAFSSFNTSHNKSRIVVGSNTNGVNLKYKTVDADIS